MKTWIVGVILLAVGLLAPRMTRAHEGHDHTVMGTVSSIDGMNLMVKAVDGKTVMVMMDAKTKITEGKNKVDAKALKIGDRVVATGPEEKGMISAETVRLGAAPVAAKATAAKK